MAYSPDPFFIGWAKKPPKALQGFLALTVTIMLIGITAAGTFIGASQADPDGGRFRFDLREQQLTGTLIAAPYPMIWLSDGAAEHLEMRTVMLNGNGKSGVAARAEGLDGARVTAKGIILERGDLQMLQLNRGFEVVPEEPAPLPDRQDLGRWRLTGEICDGRCYVGAMRPGDGVAHKACANLCISGGQPPVFVTDTPVEGARFMLMGTDDYAPLPESVLHYTGAAVQLEGRLERVGDLTLLLVDPNSLEVR